VFFKVGLKGVSLRGYHESLNVLLMQLLDLQFRQKMGRMKLRPTRSKETIPKKGT
jgi:hypothetical protein